MKTTRYWLSTGNPVSWFSINKIMKYRGWLCCFNVIIKTNLTKKRGKRIWYIWVSEKCNILYKRFIILLGVNRKVECTVCVCLHARITTTKYHGESWRHHWRAASVHRSTGVLFRNTSLLSNISTFKNVICTTVNDSHTVRCATYWMYAAVKYTFWCLIIIAHAQWGRGRNNE